MKNLKNIKVKELTLNECQMTSGGGGIGWAIGYAFGRMVDIGGQLLGGGYNPNEDPCIC